MTMVDFPASSLSVRRSGPELSQIFEHKQKTRSELRSFSLVLPMNGDEILFSGERCARAQRNSKRRDS